MDDKIRKALEENQRRALDVDRMQKSIDRIRKRQEVTHKLHGDVDDTFASIFRGAEDRMSYPEKQVLSGYFHGAITDVMLNAPHMMTDLLAGAIQFLMDTGHLTEEQEEELWMLMNRIEKERYQ